MDFGRWELSPRRVFILELEGIQFFRTRVPHYMDSWVPRYPRIHVRAYPGPEKSNSPIDQVLSVKAHEALWIWFITITRRVPVFTWLVLKYMARNYEKNQVIHIWKSRPPLREGPNCPPPSLHEEGGLLNVSMKWYCTQGFPIKAFTHPIHGGHIDLLFDLPYSGP